MHLPCQINFTLQIDKEDLQDRPFRF